MNIGYKVGELIYDADGEDMQVVVLLAFYDNFFPTVNPIS